MEKQKRVEKKDKFIKKKYSVSKTDFLFQWHK